VLMALCSRPVLDPALCSRPVLDLALEQVRPRRQGSSSSSSSALRMT
jgi:hypothetical protein